MLKSRARLGQSQIYRVISRSSHFPQLLRVVKMWFAVFLGVLAVVSAKPHKNNGHHQTDTFAGSILNCGKGANLAQLMSSPYIVGGDEAAAHSWPWMVAVTSSTGTQFCGGTLIDAHHVVSAAHCFQGSWGIARNIRLVIGSHNKHTAEFGQETHTPSSIKNHDNYNPNTLQNDIALLTLSQPAGHGGDTIGAACVGSEPFDTNSICYTKGWGNTQTGQDPSNLREVQVHLIEHNTCNQGSWYNGEIDEASMVCAGYENGGRDSCQGDSGGPLTCRSSSGQWYLVGITSWGYGCADPRNPGVYTRVSNYHSWLAQQGVQMAG